MSATTSDFAIFRPATDQWIIKTAKENTLIEQFGDPAAGDIPVPGVYNQFDSTESMQLAVYRPGTGQWILNNGVITQFGDPAHGDIPVPGAYLIPNIQEFAVFRPGTDQWILDQPVSNIVQFGDPAHGDVPVPGNYDGTATTELAVFRPATDQWLIAGPRGLEVYQFGDPARGDIPAPGDYDGVGHTELAVYRPSTGQWIIDAPGGVRIVQFGDPSHGDRQITGYVQTGTLAPGPTQAAPVLQNVQIDNETTLNSITFQFRWNESSPWTSYTLAPGNGQDFSTYDSSPLAPEIQFQGTVSTETYLLTYGTGTPVSTLPIYAFEYDSLALDYDLFAYHVGGTNAPPPTLISPGSTPPPTATPTSAPGLYTDYVGTLVDDLTDGNGNPISLTPTPSKPKNIYLVGIQATLISPGYYSVTGGLTITNWPGGINVPFVGQFYTTPNQPELDITSPTDSSGNPLGGIDFAMAFLVNADGTLSATHAVGTGGFHIYDDNNGVTDQNAYPSSPDKITLIPNTN